MNRIIESIKTNSKGRRVWIISCVAAFCLVFAVIVSLSVIKSEAKVTFILDKTLLTAGDYTDSPSLADLLNIVYTGDIDLMSGTTEYYYPIGSIMDNSRMFTVTSSSGTKISGYQCYIYANAVYNKLFGEYVGHGTGLKNSVNVIENAPKATYELFKNAGVVCGAYMRTTENADGSYSGSRGHSLVIMKYDENEITYIEGNGEGQGIVRGAILSWDDFNARQLTGRSRRICHVTQPKAEYYNSLYGSSYVSVKYLKGDSTGGTVPSSLKLKYRDTFTIPDKGTLVNQNYSFSGWYCQRTDNGYIANAKGGWSSAADVSSGKATKRTFRPGEVLVFDSYFILSGGQHMMANQEIVFIPIWNAPDPPRPEGPFAIGVSYEKTGNYVDLYIDVTNNPGVSYLELLLEYPDDLKMVSVSNGEVLGGMYAGDAIDIISWKMAGDLFAKGRLITVRFEATGVLTGKTITYSILSCCGEPGDVPVSPASGSVTIN
ncbi:MAG: hypothetical protein K6B54_03255 [Clostridia bacterium]|nr:hypothetical protein [Clostridia bacterium]